MLTLLKKHFPANAHYLVFQKKEGEMDHFIKTKFDEVDGEKLTELGKQIGWVPDQFPPLFFCRSCEIEIAESIAFSRDRMDIDGDDLKIARRLLDETGLRHIGEKSPHYLSEGERKLVWLLCQYAKSPRYLIIGSLLKNLSAHSFSTVFHFLIDGHDRRMKLIVGCTQTEKPYFERLKPHPDWKHLSGWPDES